MENYDKLDIADEMLESAIELYLDNKKYFSALHLAGAAQEIYGKWLRINGGQDFSTIMLDHAGKIFEEPIDRKAIKKEERRPKNSIKHMDSVSDRFACINPKFDSFIAITEAVMEYLMLQRSETENIKKFKFHIIQTKEKGI